MCSSFQARMSWKRTLFPELLQTVGLWVVTLECIRLICSVNQDDR